MPELDDDRVLELMKILNFSWENNVISLNEHDSLIAKLQEGDTGYVENFLIKKGIDERIIDNLPPKNKKQKYEKTHSEEYLKNMNLNDYRYLKNETEQLKNLCFDYESKNSILEEKLNKSKVTHNELQREYKSLVNEIEKTKAERNHFIEELKKTMNENSELKNKFQQKRIDEKIPEYVVDVSQKLDAADQFFTKMSRNWSIAGIILAMLAVTAAFCTFIYGLETISDISKLTPTSIIYTFVRGGLGIALLSWIAYISFSNARNYTHESILRKDRQHALTFGRLFLQIYGSTATKEDAINVFKDWNMSGDTAFSSKSKTPPNPMSYIESMKNMFSRSNNANKDSSKEDD